MTAPAAPDIRSKGWAFYTTVALAAVVLYVLSIGPVFGICWRFGGAADMLRFEALYAPVIWSSKHLGTDVPLYAWMRWWGDLLAENPFADP